MEGKKISLKNEVLKNSLLNSSFMFVNKVGALIFTIIITRFLTPEFFGIYGLAMSITAIFLLFADLGINQTTIRYVSSEIGKNKEKAIKYFNFLFKIKISLALLVSALLLMLSYPLSIYIFKKPAIFTPLLILSIYISIYVISSFFESLFFVFKKVGYLVIKEGILQLLKIFSVVILFLMINSIFYLNGIFVGILISHILVLIIVLFFIKKVCGFMLKKSKADIDKGRVLRFLGYSSITIASTAILSYIDVIMLGIFVKAEYVGFYKAAITLIFGLIALLNIYYILLSIFTQIPKEKIEYVFNTILRYMGIITIPAIIGIFILSNYIIRIVFGAEYLQATVLLRILSPLLFLEIVSSTISSLFLAKEKPKYIFRINILTTILNIILNYVIIKSLLPISYLAATSGVAASTLISRLFYFLNIFHLTRKKIQIKIKKRNFIKPAISSVIMGLFLIGINYFIKDLNIITGILEVILGIIIYFGFLILIKGLKKEDIIFLKSFVKLR